MKDYPRTHVADNEELLAQIDPRIRLAAPERLRNNYLFLKQFRSVDDLYDYLTEAREKQRT